MSELTLPQRTTASRIIQVFALVTLALSGLALVRSLLFADHNRYNLEAVTVSEGPYFMSGRLTLFNAAGTEVLYSNYFDRGRNATNSGMRRRISPPAGFEIRYTEDSSQATFAGRFTIDREALRLKLDRHEVLLTKFPQLFAYEADVHTLRFIVSPAGRVELRLSTTFEIDEVLGVYWLSQTAGAPLPPVDTLTTGLYRYSVHWTNTAPPPASIRWRTGDGGGHVLSFGDSLTAKLLAGPPTLIYSDDDPATRRPYHHVSYPAEAWAHALQAGRGATRLGLRYGETGALVVEVLE